MVNPISLDSQPKEIHNNGEKHGNYLLDNTEGKQVQRGSRG
jgi:hypothetical protein